MSLGIGLGSFMKGLERGVGLGERMQDSKLKSDNRSALAAIDTETKQKFDQGVAAGQYKPEQFDEFWKKYAMPKRTTELLRQGDHAGAKAYQEWGQSEGALNGGRLFSSALFKAQTGDHGGALDDAIAAGKVKGYIDHGYEIGGKEELRDASGALLGFRVNLKTADGKTQQQDIKIGDIPRVVSMIANPDAAWQSQVEAQKRARERQENLGDYEARKKIDARYREPKDADPGKAYDAAFTALSKDIGFTELSPEEQAKRVRDHLKRRQEFIGASEAPGLGGGGERQPPPRKVKFDTVTGKPVEESAKPAKKASPAEDEPKAKPKKKEAPAKEPTVVEKAQAAIDRGAPTTARVMLMAAGIPEDQWPAALRKKGRSADVGLGQSTATP